MTSSRSKGFPSAAFPAGPNRVFLKFLRIKDLVVGADDLSQINMMVSEEHMIEHTGPDKCNFIEAGIDGLIFLESGHRMLDPAGQKTDIITEEPNGAINDQLIKVAKIVIESSRIVASSLGNLSNRQVIIAIFLQDMLGRLNKNIIVRFCRIVISSPRDEMSCF